MRFPENLQRFALCCTLCCTDVALRCTETPQFLLHRCPLQGLVPPDHCARNLVQRKAPGGRPTIGRRPLRGSIFGYGNTTWFWCHGVGPLWFGATVIIYYDQVTHRGSESSNRSVSSVICTAFNLGQVPLGPCSVAAASHGNFECSECIFGAFGGAVFWPPNIGPHFGPSTCGRKGFLLVGCRWCHFGGPFSAPHLLQFFQFRNPMLGSVNAAASHGASHGLVMMASS